MNRKENDNDDLSSRGRPPVVCDRRHDDNDGGTMTPTDELGVCDVLLGRGKLQFRFFGCTLRISRPLSGINIVQEPNL